MALPVYSTLAVMRNKLAARLGFGGNVNASINELRLEAILEDAQINLWRRMDWAQMYDDSTVNKWIFPSATGIAYPDELDENRISGINVDYNADGQWYPLTEGIEHIHDSIVDTDSWPRRFEREASQIQLWPTVDVADTYEITDITKADPGIVTIAAAPTNPVLIEGQRIYIKDVGGMVELTPDDYMVGPVISTTVFELFHKTDVNLDTTFYTAYTSGGIIQQGYKLRFQGIRRLNAFVGDSDLPTLPEDIVFLQALVYAKAEYRHPDVQVYAQELRKAINRVRGSSVGKKRYIPLGRNRRSKPLEYIRPILT